MHTIQVALLVFFLGFSLSFHQYSVIRRAKNKVRAVKYGVHSIQMAGAQDGKKCKTPKAWGRLVAHASILTGNFLPGKSIACEKSPPASIVATESSHRQNPRDVWTGAKRLVGEKHNALQKKHFSSNLKVEKVSSPGTFVSSS